MVRSGDEMELCGRKVGGRRPMFLIAGPCVLESEDLALGVAEHLCGLADRLGVHIIFKGSFDKANRSSAASYRGPGMEEGLRILAKVRDRTGLPVLTDIHEAGQAAPVAEVVDMLQTPAFLARQTDLIVAAARTGRPVNIKKAQFMAPADMAQVLAKARSAGSEAGHRQRFLLCERGASFGYNGLVTDLRGLEIMGEMGAPIVFDATHSVQLPGANGSSSGGERRFVPLLARGAVAAGIAGLFIETHPDPDRALSDGPNSWPLEQLEPLMADLIAIDRLVKGGSEPSVELESGLT